MIQFATLSDIGKRETMEDAYFFTLNPGKHDGWAYGGIYDGHMGDYAAQYAAERLHELFLEKISRKMQPAQAFTAAYEEISEALRKQSSGTVAVDFLLREDNVVVANAGDARLIVVRARSLEQLTKDHRLSDPQERERIVQHGGTVFEGSPYVWRGEAGLMPTRSLGDEYFKAVGIIATPDIREYQIAEGDLWILAASDGIFDKMSNEAVATFIREFDTPDVALQELKNEILLHRRGTDNLTAILIKLR